MKSLKNNFLIKLIISICLCLIILNFAGMNEVYAAKSEKLWGGTLLNPVIDLLTACGDWIMEILHDSIQAQNAAIIPINTDTGLGTIIWAIVLGILVVVLTVAVGVLLTGGVALIAAKLAGTAMKAAFVLAVASSAGGTLIAGLAAGTVAGVAVKEGAIPDALYLPAFTISAEEIFRNDILLFDVNFFKPKPSKTVTEKIQVTSEEEFIANLTVYSGEFSRGILDTLQGGVLTKEELKELNIILGPTEISNKANAYSSLIKDVFKSHEESTDITLQELIVFSEGVADGAAVADALNDIIVKADDAITYNIKNAAKVYTGMIVDGEDYYSPNNIKGWIGTTVGTAESGPIHILIFLNVTHKAAGITEKEVTTTIVSTAEQLQEIVSTWYFIIRNVSLLVLMLILIYIGIRIVIGSTAGEKAKYKERLMDWFVAVCLIMVMHYIMVFAVELVDKIIDLIGTINNENLAYIELTSDQSASAKKELEGYNTIGLAYNENYPNGQGQGAIAYYDEKENRTSINGTLIWPTDLAGLYRIQSQMTEEGTTLWAGYSFCYVVLVLYTLFFAYTYLRRVVYMAFLTMIAPLVALTYPIDKITDGKAQAFNSWLREYIFNLMIQPMHLLLYTILVSSAFTLATENPLYALVAIGFMMPAEKLMRKFFGFEKAQTPGLLGGAAGAAFAMTGLQSLMKWHGKGRSSSTNEKSKDDDLNIKYSSSDGVDTFGVLAGSEATTVRETPASLDLPGGGSPRGDSPRGDSSGGDLPGGDSSGGDSLGGDSPRGDSSGGDLPGGDSSGGDSSGGTRDGDGTTTRSTRFQTPIPPASAAATEAEENARRARRRAAISARGSTARVVRRTRGSGRHTMAGGLIRGYGRALGNKVLKRVQKGQPIRALLRGATGLAGGALFGAAGLALGIASGDPGNAFKYTTAGMAGGYAAGSGTAGSVVDTLSVNANEMKKEAEIYAYGDEYGEIKYNEALEEDLMSESNINYLRTTFGYSRAQAREFLDTTGRECYASGVQDVEEMATIQQVMSNTDETKSIPTIEEAIAATNLKRRLPSKLKNMSDKKVNEYRETYAKTFAEKLGLHYGLQECEQKRIMDTERAKEDQTIRYMKNLESANSSLTEV